jgi:hypothetical protein
MLAASMPAIHSTTARVIIAALAGFLAAPVTLAATSAHADPVVIVPPAGKLTLHHGQTRLSLTAEAHFLAILHAAPASTYPELGNIDSIQPALAEARVGLLAHGSCLSLSLRLDASEALRVSRDDLDTRPAATAATIGRFIDDAALFWTPRVWASMAIGRHKVPFSRFRQLERNRLTAAAVPFLVDRLGPDRRWGATLYGDLGSIAYATGAYADLDSMETRPDVAQPVTDNAQALAMGYVGWTPRAPIGPDHMPTPPSDLWFHTVRLFGGIGVLWRAREGADRIDVSLAGQLKYRRFALMGELFAYSDSDAAGLSGAIQISALVHERAALFISGEYDLEVEDWAAGGGASYFITADRRTRLTATGWLRRGFHGEARGDGAVLSLQASL